MNKIRIPTITVLVSSLLFSLISINFSFDFSLLAFPVSAAGSLFLCYYLFFKLYKKNDYKALKISIKLLQYIPFVLLASFILRRAGKNGTYYWYDLISVLLWCSVFISSLVLLYLFDEKRIELVNPEWKNILSKSKKSLIKSFDFSAKKLFFEVLDWVDALLQAVFMVLLIQIFILQLYVIPSESMVPSFLIGDRVVVTKTASGPKFPLSQVGFPCLKTYKRGDVIVFRNPHYSLDRKSEVRTVISQIVYMLTFTKVNLNVDEMGDPKADPLVKRICGEPGEQLLMQDGVLYSRIESDNEFRPVLSDSVFATWNLNEVGSNVKSGIKTFPLNQDEYDLMLFLEKKRREYNIFESYAECQNLYLKMKNLNRNNKKSHEQDIVLSLADDFIFRNYIPYSQYILSSEKGLDWYKSFLLSWAEKGRFGYVYNPSSVDKATFTSLQKENRTIGDFNGDLYAEANYKLNMMIKVCLGKLYLRTAELISNGVVDSNVIIEDSNIQALRSEAYSLKFYLSILDQRNMPVFPESKNGKPDYIPEGSYFMMGDNRFNSLDMRHSYKYSLVPLTDKDPYSVQYHSNMAPQYVDKKYILGSAKFRFLPLNRVGSVKTR